MNLDDVWASDSDEEILNRRDPRDGVSNAEIKRVHTKQGYLDGLSHAQESSLQQGFDDGYPKGGELAIRVGNVLATVLCYDAGLFEQCKKELNIARVLDKQYFDDDLEVDGHPVLEAWERRCRSWED